MGEVRITLPGPFPNGRVAPAAFRAELAALTLDGGPVDAVSVENAAFLDAEAASVVVQGTVVVVLRGTPSAADQTAIQNAAAAHAAVPTAAEASAAGAADRAPTAADDANAGFAVGNVWEWTAAGRVWILADATPGAARWVELLDAPQGAAFGRDFAEAEVPGPTWTTSRSGSEVAALALSAPDGGRFLLAWSAEVAASKSSVVTLRLELDAAVVGEAAAYVKGKREWAPVAGRAFVDLAPGAAPTLRAFLASEKKKRAAGARRVRLAAWRVR